MKKLLVAALVLSATLLAAPTVYAKSLKIGVINLRQVVEKAPQVKKLRTALRKEFKPRRDKIVSLQTEIQNKIVSFKRNDAVMSIKEKSDAKQTIISMKRKLRRLEEDYQQDLSNEQNEKMQAFFANLKDIVNNIAKQGKYDLVLQKNAVPFTSSRIDITNRVLKQLG